MSAQTRTHKGILLSKAFGMAAVFCAAALPIAAPAVG